MRTIDRVLIGIFVPLLLFSLYMAFFYAPEEKVMGIVQRIFYFHVSSAWTGLISFLLVFIAGLLYLWKKDVRYDRLGYAAAELGVVFCTVVLVTGPIWAKPVWNVWWTWDPRLTSTFILWLIFVAYLLLRSSLRDRPAVRTYSAVYGIIGFVDVPIVYMSIYWWRTIHPRVITPARVDLDPRMWNAVLVCFLTMLVLYTILIRYRMRLEVLRERIDHLEESLQELSL
jgi:heme exporter protein C